VVLGVTGARERDPPPPSLLGVAGTEGEELRDPALLLNAPTARPPLAVVETVEEGQGVRVDDTLGEMEEAGEAVGVEL